MRADHDVFLATRVTGFPAAGSNVPDRSDLFATQAATDKMRMTWTDETQPRVYSDLIFPQFRWTRGVKTSNGFYSWIS